MKPMRYFLDTHDRQLGTFPEQLNPVQGEAFFAQYEQACQAEGARKQKKTGDRPRFPR